MSGQYFQCRRAEIQRTIAGRRNLKFTTCDGSKVGLELTPQNALVGIRPPRREGDPVCATFTSTSFSRPEERRRNLRLRVSSLIYAQLGADNGGVVVNLGLDGILFQAAHKLGANQNSTITLKLRGAGLNAEIAGKVVWVGATQKAVGVSFKSLPANVKQSIADWIARESGPAESDTPKQGAPQRSISEIADMAVPGERTIRRSLSAALALSRAMSADDAASASEDLSGSRRAVPAESSTVILPLAPSFEMFPSEGYSRAATDAPLDGFDSDDVLDRTVANINPPDKTTVEGPPEKDESPDADAIVGLPPISVLKQSLAQALKEQEIVIPTKALEKSADAPSPRPASKIKPPEKIQKITPRTVAPAVPASPVPKLTATRQIAKKRIPPQILAAWNRLSLQQRRLLTHAGTVCLGLMLGLLLILLVTHVQGSSSHTVKSLAQQSTILPDSPSEESGSANEFPKQGPPLLPATRPLNQPKPSEPSMFLRIVSSIFGSRSDGPPQINDYQMGLAVWTSQSSGYYYCSDDPYVKSVQSGVPMLQGDALQAGYRPRLGQFCN